MSSDLAVVLCTILVVMAVSALFSKSVSVSLIMLFYTSLVIGIIFTVYGSVLIGVLEIITFAGGISVMLLSTVLMTRESKLDVGGSKAKLALVVSMLAGVVFAVFEITSKITTGVGASPDSYNSPNLLDFVWTFRPWDLLVLLIVFSSSTVVVANLFSRENS